VVARTKDVELCKELEHQATSMRSNGVDKRVMCIEAFALTRASFSSPCRLSRFQLRPVGYTQERRASK
jgi:hypothetical protein